MSGYPTFTSIPRVDGLSTDTPVLGRHNINLNIVSFFMVLTILIICFYQCICCKKYMDLMDKKHTLISPYTMNSRKSTHNLLRVEIKIRKTQKDLNKFFKLCPNTLFPLFQEFFREV